MTPKSGFYKLIDSELIYAPNFVINKTFELLKEKHSEYSYPVDGWIWFDTETEALGYFNVEG